MPPMTGNGCWRCSAGRVSWAELPTVATKFSGYRVRAPVLLPRQGRGSAPDTTRSFRDRQAEQAGQPAGPGAARQTARRTGRNGGQARRGVHPRVLARSVGQTHFAEACADMGLGHRARTAQEGGVRAPGGRRSDRRAAPGGFHARAVEEQRPPSRPAAGGQCGCGERGRAGQRLAEEGGRRDSRRLARAGAGRRGHPDDGEREAGEGGLDLHRGRGQPLGILHLIEHGHFWHQVADRTLPQLRRAERARKFRRENAQQTLGQVGSGAQGR